LIPYRGQDPAEQSNIDKLLSNEPGLADIAKTAISIAMCKAGAKQAGQEVYHYIAEMGNVYNPCVPVPHVTLVEGGRAATNKLPVQVGSCIHYRFHT
jgi:enolase